MVFYPQIDRRSMEEFGIDIPIMPSNAKRTVDHLLSIPALAARQTEWLVREPVEPLSRADVALAHSPDYVERLFGAGCDREIERTFELVKPDGSFYRYDPARARLPLSVLRDQTLRSAAATRRGAELAISHPDGFCFCLSGGMHHGKADRGEGFCIVNDLVIALRALQRRGSIGTAWIVDVDAHKGDGTASLTTDDATIATLSIHMAHGWPLDQPRSLADGRPNPVFAASTVDIGVAEGEENHYLSRLEAGLARLEAAAPRPDFLLVVDGADPWEGDQLPSTQLLRLTLDQIAARDRLLYGWGRALGVPMLWVTAGNYGPDSWQVFATFLEWQLGSAR